MLQLPAVLPCHTQVLHAVRHTRVWPRHVARIPSDSTGQT